MPYIKKSGRKKPWAPQREPFEMANKAGGFYHSPAWRKFRMMVLTREPLCRMCDEEDRLTAAQMVDHIIPISDGGAALELSNVQPLCHSCHGRKSKKDAINKNK